jgi:hypothetical protein
MKENGGEKVARPAPPVSSKASKQQASEIVEVTNNQSIQTVNILL